MIRRLCGERGYSLVEMVAVCAILGIVLVGVTSVFVSGSRAELGLNNRFQAQTQARLGLDQLRLDARSACAANVLSSGSKLLFTYVPNSDPTQCGGVAANASYPKVTFCALQSPTLSTAYALYRASATDNSCTTTNGRLIADHVTTSVLFSTAVTIPPGQVQTINVTLPISYKVGQAGAPYTLAQTLAVRNSVYQTSGASKACTDTNPTVSCTIGRCPTGITCYPPVIK